MLGVAARHQVWPDGAAVREDSVTDTGARPEEADLVLGVDHVKAGLPRGALENGNISSAFVRNFINWAGKEYG